MKKFLFWTFFILILAGLSSAYTYLWNETANQVRDEYIRIISNLDRNTDINTPIISGFPGPIKLSVLQETITRDIFTFDINVIEISGWPIPFTPINLNTGPIQINTPKWSGPVTFQGFNAKFYIDNTSEIKLDYAALRKDELIISLNGILDLDQRPYPKLDTVLTLAGFEDFIASLSQKGVIEDRIAMFLTFGFSNLLNEEGLVRVPLTERRGKLYAGPIPIMDLPQFFEPVESPEQLPRLEPYNQLGPAQ